MGCNAAYAGSPVQQLEALLGRDSTYEPCVRSGRIVCPGFHSYEIAIIKMPRMLQQIALHEAWPALTPYLSAEPRSYAHSQHTGTAEHLSAIAYIGAGSVPNHPSETYLPLRKAPVSAIIFRRCDYH